MWFNKPWHELTNHHIIPKSYWWNRYAHNIASLRDNKHKALHTMFSNNLPHEQVLNIVDLTGKAINKVFSQAIMEVVNDFTPEEIYNQKCCDIQKLLRHIEETKNK